MGPKTIHAANSELRIPPQSRNCALHDIEIGKRTAFRTCPSAHSLHGVWFFFRHNVSNHWKLFSAIFQSLETFFGDFPMIGKRDKISLFRQREHTLTDTGLKQHFHGVTVAD
ncbi:MAG: hypothetical protein EOM20_05515 [Spartobacteria bacterium]|nr:hypothetical protein [Spartobacteria bacterium]